MVGKRIKMILSFLKSVGKSLDLSVTPEERILQEAKFDAFLASQGSKSKLNNSGTKTEKQAS